MNKIYLDSQSLEIELCVDGIKLDTGITDCVIKLAPLQPPTIEITCDARAIGDLVSKGMKAARATPEE